MLGDEPAGYFIRPGSTRGGGARGWVLGVLPRALAVLEMGQDAFDHGRVFDAGNDLPRPATGFAGLDIYLEHALEALC